MKHSLITSTTLLLFLIVSISSQTVFVRTLHTPSLDSTQAIALTEVLASNLRKHCNWDIITQNEVTELLAHEIEREIVASDPQSRITDIAQQIGAPFIISGTIVPLGNTYLTTLSLLDTHKSKGLFKTSTESPSVEQLPASLTTLSHTLALGGEQAFAQLSLTDTTLHKKQTNNTTTLRVYFTTTPKGAVLFVDDLFLSQATPVAKQLSRGPHTILFAHEGYAPWKKEVIIQDDNQVISAKLQEKTLHLTLVAYDSITNKERHAKVFIDDTYYGTTPYRGVVSSAKKAITLRDEQLGEQTIPFPVTSKDSMTLRIPLALSHFPKVEGVLYGMKLLEGGTYERGGDTEHHDALPIQTVSLDRFWIDTTEVTGAEYQRLMGRDPSHYKGENHPVDWVSWFEAIAYCNARSREADLEPMYNEKTGELIIGARGFRLPTEAEWEYAARGEEQTNYPWVKTKKAGKYANFADKSTSFNWREKYLNDKVGETSAPVASYKPNSFGLYDMAGNVSEWCYDFYSPSTYTTTPVHNPLGPITGKKRVIRGGSWNDNLTKLNAANRESEYPYVRKLFTGFRCVLPLY